MTYTDWDINVAGQEGQAGLNGAGYQATSATSITIGAGSHTFATAFGLAYAVGGRVRVASNGTSGAWMDGAVTSYSGNYLTMVADALGPTTGTFSDWNLSVAGAIGATGPTGGVPEAPTDGSIYGRGSLIWTPVLPLSGGTLTGNLNLNYTAPAIILNKTASGAGDAIIGQTNGTNRWAVSLGNVNAETGSNTGSDFTINRYNDAGTLIDQPIIITRSTGAITIADAVTANGIVTVAGLNSNITMNKAGSGYANNLWGDSGGVPRWVIVPGTNTPESGGNVGSDFMINRYSDTGAAIDTPFLITRSSGVVTVNDGLTSGANIAMIGTSPTIVINKPASGQQSALYGQMAGKMRWNLLLGNPNAETGSNAGSDFQLARYNDAGAVIDSPILINRSNGQVQMPDGAFLSSPLQMNYGNPQIFLNKTASGQNNLITGELNGVYRWIIIPGDAVAEGGSNTGSNFSIYRYNDAGTFQDAPFGISRATGQVVIGVGGISTSGSINTAGSLSAAGINCTGQLGMNYANPVVSLNKTASGQSNQIIGYTNGSARWAIYPGDTTAETGGNVGSNFYIARCGDTGAAIDAVFQITRSSGEIIHSQNITVAGGMGIKYWTGTHYYGFNWQSQVTGLASIVVDGGGAQYALANGSDERIKQDIAPTTFDCLAQIEKIRLYEFRWQDHTNPGDPQPIDPTPESLIPCGFIAQRLYEDAPYMAIQGNDTEGPWGPDNPLTIWDVEKNVTLATLVGAVQQLSQANKELAARVAALEGAR